MCIFAETKSAQLSCSLKDLQDMKPFSAIVITPVKNSLDKTQNTIKAVLDSNQAFDYYIYDDYSDEEISRSLKAAEKGFTYIHLSELTDTPSPNYLTILQHAQNKAIQEGLPLIIVESDVSVRKDTLGRLVEFIQKKENIGMLGAITVDEKGEVNYPYKKFKHLSQKPHSTKRSLSFCCTLLSLSFLESYSFDTLDQSKDWFDTSISMASLDCGFVNYILMDTPVTHHPHSSRPWKQEKYKNPFKYYWNKITKGRDKI